MTSKKIALILLVTSSTIAALITLLSPNPVVPVSVYRQAIPTTQPTDTNNSVDQTTNHTTSTIRPATFRTRPHKEQFVPQLNWADKTQQLNGQTISYRFGEGNPNEVALPPNEYKAQGEKDGVPYVTPEAEKTLHDLLADPSLPQVLTKCNTFYQKEMQKLNPHINPNDIPALLTNADVDIENYLVIDPISKRKTINADIDNRLNEFFNLLSNPMTGQDFALKCLGSPYLEDVKRLQEKFHALGRAYTNTGDAILGQEWPK